MNNNYTLYLLLGSNLGNSLQTLSYARREITHRIGPIEKASHIYNSPAWGFSSDNIFYNQALKVHTNLAPFATMQEILKIEEDLGRTRKACSKEAQYTSRIIDIDILFFENFIIRSTILSVPHPRLAERAFVLVPMNEIAPELVHPDLNQSINELTNKCIGKKDISLCLEGGDFQEGSGIWTLKFDKSEHTGTGSEYTGTGSDFLSLENDRNSKEEKPLTKSKIFSTSLRFLAIEGNIGSGKTSLSTQISNDYGAKLVVEAFENNAFLSKFYTDPERYSFPLELGFLAERYRQAREEFVQDLFAPFLISDFLISKSLIFAKRTLQNDEFKLFSKLFNIILTSTPKPDLYVYLHSDTKRLKSNILKRGRSYELNIEESYLAQIEEGYMEYIKTLNPEQVLLIDCNHLDFVNREEDYQYILEKIEEKASKLA